MKEDNNGRWVSRQMVVMRLMGGSDERGRLQDAGGRVRVIGKLKVGRASLGEEREGLEGCAIIINAGCRSLQSAGRHVVGVLVCSRVVGEGLSGSRSHALAVALSRAHDLGRRVSGGQQAHGTPAGAGGHFCARGTSDEGRHTPTHRRAASNRRLSLGRARG